MWKVLAYGDRIMEKSTTNIGTANKNTKEFNDKATALTEDLLKDLYLNKKLSAEEIARQVHCARGTVYRYLQKYNLYKRKQYTITSTVHIDAELRKKVLTTLKNGRSIAETAKILKIATADVRVVLKDEFVLKYLQLESLLALSKTYHCDRRTIRKYLAEKGITYIEHKIEKVKRHRSKDHDRPLTKYLEEVITGELLGDGHIRVRTKNIYKKYPKYTLEEYQQACKTLNRIKEVEQLEQVQDLTTTIQEFNKAIKIIAKFPTSHFWLHTSILEGDWIQGIGKIFKKSNYPVHIAILKEKDKHGRDKWTITLQSKTSIQLTKLHEKWYSAETGEKIIPKDLKLTPNIVLHWFIGDGSRGHHEIILHTESFSKDDVEILKEKLEQALDVQFHLKEHKYKDYTTRDYWMLSISSTENINKFYSYINQADKQALIRAKRNFPWKFSSILLKRTVLEHKKHSHKFIKLYLEQKKNIEKKINK